jgi:hypothetical protein
MSINLHTILLVAQYLAQHGSRIQRPLGVDMKKGDLSNLFIMRAGPDLVGLDLDFGNVGSDLLALNSSDSVGLAVVFNAKGVGRVVLLCDADKDFAGILGVFKD